MNTKTVTLKTGYFDHETQERWTEVEVRAPKFDDEIKAEEASGRSTSQSLMFAHLINLCVVRFGPKEGRPGAHIIRSLSRMDASTLYQAVLSLEADEHLGAEGDAPLGEEGSEE